MEETTFGQLKFADRFYFSVQGEPHTVVTYVKVNKQRRYVGNRMPTNYVREGTEDYGLADNSTKVFKKEGK
jgi:hypothetical protein